MASLRRKAKSKYFFACFTYPDGSRAQRSTRTTDRKAAQKIADDYEVAARQRASARQAQRVIADIWKRQTGRLLPASTARQYFTSWLARKKPETAAGTYTAYDAGAKRFLGWLGESADMEFRLIDSDDIRRFRAKESERVGATTVNHTIKFLRMVFKDAKGDGIIAENPVEGVARVKGRKSVERRPFTVDELKRLLKVADDEWRSLIIFGLYTGQRLGDLARLTWANLEPDESRLTTGKTGRQQIIPLAEPLRQHIESLPAGDDPRQPVHPQAFATVKKSASGKVGTLSRQFYELMARAGMVPHRKHRAKKDSTGRNSRRETSEISFHCLRNTATSLMKRAGISSAIVQDIIGHESAAISALYTDIDEATKRSALEKLPNIL